MDLWLIVNRDVIFGVLFFFSFFYKFPPLQAHPGETFLQALVMLTRNEMMGLAFISKAFDKTTVLWCCFFLPEKGIERGKYSIFDIHTYMRLCKKEREIAYLAAALDPLACLAAALGPLAYLAAELGPLPWGPSSQPKVTSLSPSENKAF